MQTSEFEIFPLQNIPIEMLDEPVHTDENPYCSDPSCFCTEQAVVDGLLTADEADALRDGRAISWRKA